MRYQSECIAVVLKRLNAQYYLPAIQREFVWWPDDVVQLFDSIMRSYPIGSFLFWELDQVNRDKWEAYRFIDEARAGGTHNKLANTDGVQQPTLILDGQQRLTSLLLGLKGTYTIKKKYRKKNDPAAWVKHRLYLDLFQDPRQKPEDDAPDGEAGVYYGFAFMDSVPKNDGEHYWFKIGKILDFETKDSFDTFLEEQIDNLPDDISRGQTKVFRSNLSRLYEAIWKDDTIAYYTEHEQDPDRVLDIFVRANEGGTKLSKSDLLLSMVIANWGGISAREEIHGFVDYLNTGLTRRNNFDKDFIMKSCLVLADLPVAYKVKNFNNQNLSLIQKRWKDFKSAIMRGIDLTNSFGIDQDNLTSANALIPVIYYLLQRPKVTLRETSSFDGRNASLVRRWLLMALLNQAFGGASDSLLRSIRETLQAHPEAKADFPVEKINAVIRRAGRATYFDTAAIQEFLSLKYGGQLTFLGLTLLYDECAWGTMPYHQDHIFPASLFSSKALSERGVDLENKWKLQVLRDRIGNLELLLSHENEQKLNLPFDKWLKTRDASFKRKHLIPDDPELWKVERFEEFVAAREKLIRQRLIQVLGPPEEEEERKNGQEK